MDIFNSIQCLKLTKFVGFDEVPRFIIKNFPVTATSALIHIFDLRLSLQHFQHRGSNLLLLLSPRKATVPLSVITDLRDNLLLRNFSKVSGFIVHEHLSRYLKHKCNSCQRGFLKSKSTVTNLLTCVDNISPAVSFQRQVDAIYFDHNRVFHLVPHSNL